MNYKSRLCWPILLPLMILLSLSVPGQQVNRWHLRQIEFDGLKKQNREQMTSASGLKIGQEVDADAFAAATQRLLRTGIFKKAGFRYSYSGNQVDLIFEVEEAELKKTPCVFDNFVWFSGQEISEAIRHHLPDFDGTAEQNELVIGQIKSALQLLLKAKNISGEVQHEVTSNEAGTLSENVFRVKGLSLKVCEVKFAGAGESMRGKLTEAAKDLIGTEYSQQDTRGFVTAALIPVYQQHGYLKAQFAASQAALAASGACQNRVVITVPAEEGLLYRWDKADWIGAQAVTAAELDKALEIRRGEAANLLKIEKSLLRARMVYSRKGYMAARFRTEQMLDDAQQLASWRVSIQEGPQYRMGKITVTGLAGNENRKLEGKWKLRAGEIYDGLYLDAFNQVIIDELGPQRIAGLGIRAGAKPKHETLTVDVTIEFSQRKN